MSVNFNTFIDHIDGGFRREPCMGHIHSGTMKTLF